MALLLSCLLITIASAQAPQDPIRDFCRRYGHQSTIIDKKLYIDGGWLYANPIAQNPIPTINTGLLYGDFDVPKADNFPTVYANLSKNSSVPNVAGGVLWADSVNKVFWLYGGEYQSAPGPFQLWGYDVLLNQWNVSTATTSSIGSSSIQRAAYGAGTTVNELGRGYYYGGYLNNLTTPLWSGNPYATSNLIIYDMDSNTLTNRTGPDSVGRAEGVMVSMPASSSGMLAYFGGVKYPYANTTAVPQSMDEILLYDISEGKWSTQRATGDIPANRRKFCGGVAWANDKSSYNIYIYGGFGFGENSTGFDDVYILTMPSFRWIKWYQKLGAEAYPHGGLTCNVVNNSQMIIMGGNFTFSNSHCDAENVMGMHNLNLGQNNPNNTQWYRYLPNLTTYNVPPAIINVIGGSVSGGATQNSPFNGWTDGKSEVWFRDQATYQARTPTRSIPSATASPQSSLDGKTKIGVIVGAAVGGLIFLILAIILFVCCRRRSKKRPRTTSPPPPSTQPPELDGRARHDEKGQSVTHVISSPGHSHSPVPSPYGSPPLIAPTGSPAYYQTGYPPHDANYQHHYPQLSPQHPYPPYQVYYAHPPQTGGISPPEGWITHPPPQQYFPPPDTQRQSPPAQEMPTVMSPGPRLAHSPPGVFHDGDRVVYYPAPIRESRQLSPQAPIRRREVGGASSPTSTTVTRTTDTRSHE